MTLFSKATLTMLLALVCTLTLSHGAVFVEQTISGLAHESLELRFVLGTDEEVISGMIPIRAGTHDWIHDDDGNLLDDGYFIYSWDAGTDSKASATSSVKQTPRCANGWSSSTRLWAGLPINLFRDVYE